MKEIDLIPEKRNRSLLSCCSSLSRLSSFIRADSFLFHYYIKMSCAPSTLTHCCSYRSTSTGNKFKTGSHASCSIYSGDCFGAPPRTRGNFAGLGTIYYNVSFGYQTMGTMQGVTTAPYNISKGKHGPDHLLVLVHGIFASPNDWTYAEAELKRRLGSKFLIYVSSSNTYIKTFAGIDGAGRRLADEVLSIVQKTESLRKISFLAHSLGGLFTRYAVAVLHSSDNLNKSQHNNVVESSDGNPDKLACISASGKIAGLEPINFITLASPHLGVRGRKQLPFLLGVTFLEKLAAPLAPMVTGRTGSQLFLTDGEPKKPPLLLRMTSDCEDLKFLSSLAAFKSRILYANVSYDRILMHQLYLLWPLSHFFCMMGFSLSFILVCSSISSFLKHYIDMVGWRTSSIRRETELVKPPRKSLDGYKHIVNVMYCPPISSDGPHFPPEAAKAKEAAKNVPNTQNTAEYHDFMEEEMIRGLQRVGWKKVDVSFHSTYWPFFAHNNIHVKSEWLHNAGTGVISHVADSLKQQESHSLIGASL